MNNKKAGTAFEAEFTRELFHRGFWAHMFVSNRNGQPFDVIAVNEHGALAVDCKDCMSGVFDYQRVEENQHMSMQMWKKRTGRDAAFAIRFDDNDIWMVKYSDLKAWGRSLSQGNIHMVGSPLLAFLRVEGYSHDNNDQ